MKNRENAHTQLQRQTKTRRCGEFDIGGRGGGGWTVIGNIKLYKLVVIVVSKI